ncbi:MAG: alpha/beta fold hydrolase, partial [Polyangia bacterium]|nr:alpha/beta fold hydrolase [Polyangia bacterium]
GVAEERPVALWLHGTTGFMGECAPSHRGGGDLLGAYLLASLGYVVVAPDYIGMDAGANFNEPPAVRHAYLNIEQTAIGSLDAVRAGVALVAGLEDNQVAASIRDLVIWGGSQGGHAALAADLLAPHYAPELGVMAVVALVPPTDLVGLGDYAVSSVNPASPAVAAMLIANHLWYAGGEGFEELLSTEAPWNAAEALPEAMYSGCDPGDAIEGATALDQVFDAELLAQVQSEGWASAEPWRCYLEENSFATSSVPWIRNTPTLMVLSAEDRLVYTPVIREDFDRLCQQGRSLEFLECAGAGHTEGAVWSLPEQTEWVAARLAGEPWDPARICQRQAPVRCSGQPEE